MHDLGVLGFSRAQRRLFRELRLRAIFQPVGWLVLAGVAYLIARVVRHVLT